MVYVYDASGQPIGMSHYENGEQRGTYVFVKNIQGDITGIYDDEGTCLVTYTYDAWGNVTVSYSNGGASTAAKYNPFRYRGYYYDTETSLYYLNSRYYDPNVGRFLNADDYINANGDLIGFNMFAYCGNNPVMGYDPDGQFFIVATIIVLTIVGGVYVYKNMPSKEEHYNRNKNNTTPSNDEIEDIINGNSVWIKQEDKYNRYHRFTNGTQGDEAVFNKKFMTDDGRNEVIICIPNNGKSPYIVTDPNNEGTYNMGPGKGIPHFVKDVLPYWIYGNSPDDTTKWYQRIFGT